ncbi:MAG: hypothetical protein A2987_06645 [Omnitrophica bacterium RIFCSPLOWO2_01_FULL_45_10]|nr:MAG: hypothetical protein A2987_06645 [Omnitrophica bacterium RIFCSPLOWO2_01_FULL_45_10]
MIFITGITGILGEALVEKNEGRRRLGGIYLGDYEMNGRDRVKYASADVLDLDRVSTIFKNDDIDCVIHAAGIADTDKCEDEKYYKAAYASNVGGTEKMLSFAKKLGAKFVYISTNAVFDGAKAPYTEIDTPNPINRYGAMKSECEKMVKQNIKDYLIVRPILMYGLNNPNERMSFFTKIIEKLEKGKKINVVDDVFENPLLSYECGRLIWRLIDKDAFGIYHIAGKTILSRYEAARTIARVFRLDEGLINPVSSSFFKTIAPRPKNTSYDTSKIESELGIEPLGFEDGLRLLKMRIENREKVGEHERY